MQSDYEIIGTHKLIGVTISDDGNFGCNIQQIFVDEIQDLKEGAIINPNNCQVVMGLNYKEFLFVAKQILKYQQSLSTSSDLFKELAQVNANQLK